MKRKLIYKKEDIEEWFKLYNLLYKLNYIKPKNRWNIDKTGFRIDYLIYV